MWYFADMDQMSHNMQVLVMTLAELAFAVVALPLYLIFVLPGHPEGGLPGFVPVIAAGVDPVAAVLSALAVFVACVAVLVLFALVFGKERFQVEEMDQLTEQFSMLDAVPLYLAAGIGEEFLFRGVCTELLGLVIGAILFTAIHIAYWKRPLLLAEVFVVALAIGGLYLATRSLLLCILVHFAYNMFVTWLLKAGFLATDA